MPAAPKISTCIVLSFGHASVFVIVGRLFDGIENGAGGCVDAVEMAIEGSDNRSSIVGAQPRHDLGMVPVAAQDRSRLRHGCAPLLHEIAVEAHHEIREQRIGGGAINGEMELAVADQEAHGIFEAILLSGERRLEARQGAAIDLLRRLGYHRPLGEKTRAVYRAQIVAVDRVGSEEAGLSRGAIGAYNPGPGAVRHLNETSRGKVLDGAPYGITTHREGCG